MKTIIMLLLVGVALISGCVDESPSIDDCENSIIDDCIARMSYCEIGNVTYGFPMPYLRQEVVC